jgi:hypothetical protein
MLYQLFFFGLIFVHIGFSNCFFGTNFHDEDYRTKSHNDITRSGAMRAFAEYIVNSKGSYSMEEFFKDGKWLGRSLNTLWTVRGRIPLRNFSKTVSIQKLLRCLCICKGTAIWYTVSDCCLTPTRGLFSYVKLNFNEMMMMRSALY